MTPFHHESRPRLANGLPCWLGTNIALPSVDLMVEPPSGSSWPRWTVLIMVGGLAGSSWAIRELDHPEVLELLGDWEAGPEETLKRWFDREPPSGNKREATLEELFEDRAQAPASNKTAEDLGL